MKMTLESTLVLCDLDSLLLNEEGSVPQVLRDVLQLFDSRGGKLTVFSQRSPRAVRTILGGVRLSAPALVCGGTLAYSFASGSGQPLCSFAGLEENVLRKLPAAVGLGIALQMADGSTRVRGTGRCTGRTAPCRRGSDLDRPQPRCCRRSAVPFCAQCREAAVKFAGNLLYFGSRRSILQTEPQMVSVLGTIL